MSEIPIITTVPVILTKDESWFRGEAQGPLEPGAIVLLPQDAVLYVPKEIELRITNSGKHGYE